MLSQAKMLSRVRVLSRMRVLSRVRVLSRMRVLSRTRVLSWMRFSDVQADRRLQSLSAKWLLLRWCFEVSVSPCDFEAR
jgi:hypothetical protein